MQRSAPLTRKTPSENAARNFAGTVSRFFASREWSKVPWKAKAHVQCCEGVQSIRGGGVGGAPPPRTGFARGRYPTSSHSATQLSTFAPLRLNVAASGLRNTCKSGVSRGGTNRPGDRARPHDRVHAPICRILALRTGGPYASAACLAPRSSRSSPCPSSSPAAAAEPPRAATTRPAPSRPTPRSTSRRRVRPEGEQRDDALAAAGKVLRTSDPEAQDRRARQEGVRGVRGPQARLRARHRAVAGREGRAVGRSPPAASEDFRGAVIAQTTDEDAAQAAIDRAVEGSEKTFGERRYKGIDYKASPESAAGLVEGFAVIGTEAEFKRTVDAVKGDGLAGRRPLPQGRRRPRGRPARHLLRRRAGRDRPGAPPGPGGRAAARAGQAADPVRQARPGRGGLRRPTASRLAVDAAAEVPEGVLPGGLGALAGSGSTPLLGELPGDAWLALGSPKLGQSAEGDLPAGRRRARRRGDRGAAAPAARARPRGGRLRWIGDVAFFARGTATDTIEGGAVIEVTDPAKAQSAFGKLLGIAQSRGDVPAKPVKLDGAEAAFEARDARLAPAARRRALAGPRRDRARPRGGRRRARLRRDAGRQRHVRRGEVRARRRPRAGPAGRRLPAVLELVRGHGGPPTPSSSRRSPTSRRSA